jgi:tetratricopeptide (TPR) repeat protein
VEAAAERERKIRDWSALILTQNQGRDGNVSAVRACWALAKTLQPIHPDESQSILIELSKVIQAERTSDRILADIAKACSAAGKQDDAKYIWKDLLKWHPRTVHKDRILSSWIEDAACTGAFIDARKWINRLCSECSDSPFVARGLLAKSEIEEAEGDAVTAKQTLEGILSNRRASGEIKAEALLRLGEHEMRGGNPNAAIGYFQRIYVMYARWKPQAKWAYLHSAEAFEQMGNKTAAARTYREMLQTELPLEDQEKARALESLARLEDSQ